MNDDLSTYFDVKSGKSSTLKKLTGSRTQITTEYKKLSIITHNSHNVITQEVLNKENSIINEISCSKEKQEQWRKASQISQNVDDAML